MEQQGTGQFIHIEAIGGALMLSMAVLALILSNTFLADYYEHALEMTMSIKVNGHGVTKDILHWINDGLMTIFFLMVGLEIKREILEGELNSIEKQLLPGIAAFGGMAFPAIIYITLNWHDSIALQGWAIPMATDIAFSLGVLSLLGSRIPFGAKIYLLAIAVFDDIGAIVIIALFYTSQISLISLFLALVVLSAMFGINRWGVRALTPYILLGIVLWFCVLQSGVHATLSGVALAFAIPLYDYQNPDRRIASELETDLQPWVMFFVLPAFALANAGVSLTEAHLEHFVDTVPLGIFLGLILGKPLGIFGLSWLSVKTGIARLPEHLKWSTIYGISMLCGIGFTMSLFIGALAFINIEGYYAMMVRIGVLSGSLLSGLIGYFTLLHTHGNTNQG